MATRMLGQVTTVLQSMFYQILSTFNGSEPSPDGLGMNMRVDVTKNGHDYTVCRPDFPVTTANAPVIDLDGQRTWTLVSKTGKTVAQVTYCAVSETFAVTMDYTYKGNDQGSSTYEASGVACVGCDEGDTITLDISQHELTKTFSDARKPDGVEDDCDEDCQTLKGEMGGVTKDDFTVYVRKFVAPSGNN